MKLCGTCGTPLDRVADPEPFASDFPGAVEQWDCPADPSHGGYHVHLDRLTPTQRARLVTVLPGLIAGGAAVTFGTSRPGAGAGGTRGEP